MSMTVTLSPGAAKVVQGMLDDGSYPDATAVVAASLAALRVDTWMVKSVLLTLEQNRADPARTLGIEETFAHLREGIRSAAKANAA